MMVTHYYSHDEQRGWDDHLRRGGGEGAPLRQQALL